MTLPYGIPLLVDLISDTAPSMRTRKVRGRRKSLIHSSMRPLMPINCKVDIICECWVASKAPSKSMNTAQTFFLLARAFKMSSCNRKAIVERPGLNPDCSGNNIYFFSINQFSLPLTILSINLQNVHVSETGRYPFGEDFDLPSFGIGITVA